MDRSELERKLIEYVDEGNIPFHMPGHKRNQTFSVLNDIGKYDITEIEGFDNYHHATGILKDEFDKAAQIYGSDKSYFLVNGCTVGILAAIASIFDEGDKILMARNCHKSVYNAVYLNKLVPTYIYPDVDDMTGIYRGIDGKDIESAFKSDDIKGIIITSPTYEGVVSDIKNIASIAHKHGIPLIVDEAHGAHFHFLKHFPKDALSEGADVVIEGLHKTLPSLTQTAIMHVKSVFVDIGILDRYVSMYQTTSPSYLFMSSISSAILKAAGAEALLKEYYGHLENVRQFLKDNLKHLGIFMENDDVSKIIITTGASNITGNQLVSRLKREFHIETEMSSLRYIVLMTSFCDDFVNYDTLCDALCQIDKTLENVEEKALDFYGNVNEIKMIPYKAMNETAMSVKINESNGYIAAEYIYVYPPGIPLIVPGEVFDDNVVKAILRYEQSGHEVIGMGTDSKVSVCRQEREKYV